MDPLELAELDIENLAARFSENPQSPLFARLADLYLSRQRVSEAVALCENGITLYPSYAGGHIVLGKCYQQLGEFTKARLSYQRALVLSPYNTVVHRLLVALPESVEDAPALSSFVPPAAAEVQAGENATPAESPVPIQPVEERMDAPLPAQAAWTPIYEPIPPPTVSAPPDEMAPAFDPFPTFEQYIDLHPTTEPTMTLEEYLKGRSSSPLSEPSTDFESLAKKLQSAKRIVPADSTAEQASLVSDTPPAAQAIVSPTMAEIYVSQNEFDAALSAYDALIIRQPAQAALFAKRIEEIKELQRNRR